jgi:hypothetical protein
MKLLCSKSGFEDCSAGAVGRASRWEFRLQAVPAGNHDLPPKGGTPNKMVRSSGSNDVMRLASCCIDFRQCQQPAGRRRSEAASVLILVLWISIGLVAIALYFANSMTFELRASDNRATGIAAEQAIEGAACYVGYVLSNFATNGAVPNNTQFSCEAVPVGDAHFWLIGRDPSGTPSTEPYFGLVDEASKLNLNRAGTNALSYLPNMTLDFADAIVDWRSTNGSGNYALDYASLGYTDKNSPFETVDELRLVYGATIDLLVGEDVNRNGVLDANETDVNGNAEFSFRWHHAYQCDQICGVASLASVGFQRVARQSNHVGSHEPAWHY